jgi:4-amino-4-deoxy-L-arabinose transferase-like glycosyltransferase
MRILRHLSRIHYFVIGIVLLAAFLRLYNLEDTLQFLGDQGRDSIIVSRIFTERDPVFIGPVTSVGNMYLGPLYYYFMLPFLWLSYPSPMGPVYAVAVLGIVTVALLYFLGKRLIGEKAALIATFLCSISWVAVTYTRFSWNPNPAPLVSLLMIYFTYTAWKKNPWHWVLVSGLFSVLLQLHYLTLLSLGGVGIIWLISAWERWQQSPKKRTQHLLQQLVPTLVGAVVVIVSFTPLVLFDSKHEWLNAKAFQNLVFKDDNFKTTSDKLPLLERAGLTVREMHGRGMHILFEITVGKFRPLNNILFFSTVAIIGWLLKQGRKRKTFEGELVLMAYLATGIFGTALYEHTVFDHYIAYLFPVSFLALGMVLAWLSQKAVGKIIAAAFIGYFVWFNIPKLPLKDAGWTISDMRTVSDSIYQRVRPGEKYNIVLLSETGDLDAQNYRYFLSTTDRPPVPTERRGEVETLFIINEDHVLERVVDSPIYEIVVFPNKEPREVYSVNNGPEITVLSTYNN